MLGLLFFPDSNSLKLNNDVELSNIAENVVKCKVVNILSQIFLFVGAIYELLYFLYLLFYFLQFKCMVSGRCWGRWWAPSWARAWAGGPPS